MTLTTEYDENHDYDDAYEEDAPDAELVESEKAQLPSLPLNDSGVRFHSDYLEVINRKLATEYGRAIRLDPKKLARQITIAGPGANEIVVTEQSAKDFVELVKALKIPPRLNGQDLILGIVSGKKIAPYVTVLGEWAIVLRDPRTLVSVETRVNNQPVQDGLYATVTATVTFANGDRYEGTDVAFLPSYDVFRRHVQEHAWEIAKATLGNDIRHKDLQDVTRFLEFTEKQLNRARAFALRFAEGAAQRRAMTAARGRVPLVPMADEEMLAHMEVAGRQELVVMMTAQGMDMGQILSVASHVLGRHIASPEMIPDDPETCTAIWNGVWDLTNR